MSEMQTTPTVPSPLTVAYAMQRREAQTADQRYALARRNGYRGPVTRNDLAAMALRNSR